jgi:hypothetical protein
LRSDRLLQDRLEWVTLLDVQVEGVRAHPAVCADRVGERQGLFDPVDEVRLAPVDGLDRKTDAGRGRVVMAFPHRLDGPSPFIVGRRL